MTEISQEEYDALCAKLHERAELRQQMKAKRTLAEKLAILDKIIAIDAALHMADTIPAFKTKLPKL